MTLIELLIASTIAGLAVVFTVGAVMAGLKGAVSHRGDASVQAYLATFAENVELAPYIPCGDSAMYSALTEPAIKPGMPAEYVATIEAVRHWNGTDLYVSGACSTPDQDKGLQWFDLKVTGAGGAPRSIQVVKRDLVPGP